MARTNLDDSFMPPRKRAPPKGGNGKGKVPTAEIPEHNSGSDGESFDSQAAFSEDDQPLPSWPAEVRSRVHQGPSRTPESTPSAADTVPAPTHMVVPVPPVQGPPPWLLNRLKDEGLRTILEEKRFSTDGVVDRYPTVWDTFPFHRFEQFIKPYGPYISTWV